VIPALVAEVAAKASLHVVTTCEIPSLFAVEGKTANDIWKLVSARTSLVVFGLEDTLGLIGDTASFKEVADKLRTILHNARQHMNEIVKADSEYEAKGGEGLAGWVGLWSNLIQKLEKQPFDPSVLNLKVKVEDEKCAANEKGGSTEAEEAEPTVSLVDANKLIILQGERVTSSSFALNYFFLAKCAVEAHLCRRAASAAQYDLLITVVCGRIVVEML
jgi:hypothetical protein